MNCVSNISGASITGDSTVTVNEYNACYLTELTGNPAGGNGSTISNPDFPAPDDGPTGPTATPSTAAVAKKLSTGQIAGIVIGVLVFVILAIVGAYFLFRKPPAGMK